VASTVLIGPDNPIVVRLEAQLRATRDPEAAGRLEALAQKRRLKAPLTVRWTEGSRRAEIDLAGHAVRLEVGGWSDWIPVTFTLNALVRVRGMVQLHLVRADQELQLYGSPVNLDPRRPASLLEPRRPSPRGSPTTSAFTARSAGRRRPGRSTRAGSTRRPSWPTATARSRTASASS
jgi:hypothetical protein